MESQDIKKIVIAGGGSAGWMSAAILSNYLSPSCEIHLVESEAIGTVGVGEATIPAIKDFNQRAGVKEIPFIKATQGTFKLGIEFVNWGGLGERYFHPFGRHGIDFDLVPFRHYWIKEFLAGRAEHLDEYSLAWAAAKAGKFARPHSDKRRVESTLEYAFHFDAGLYAKFLREISEQRGVVRHEGKILDVHVNGETGYIESLALEGDREITGDFFIDCTGFRALLLGEKLRVGYNSWTEWLPCNRAVAAPTTNVEPLTPYTRSTARDAGWQWRIPLQHRMGNGYVYCSDFVDDDAAAQTLVDNLEGELLADPRVLRFTTGRRKKLWHKNCVAIGLSAGFLEPLESTSLHLIQTALVRLLAVFPNRGDTSLLEDQFNMRTAEEYERIRDFLILHYHATKRRDTPLWRYCATMDIPDTLKVKIDNFRASGVVVAHERELFTTTSWLAVYLGQHIVPQSAPAVAAQRSTVPAGERLKDIHRFIGEAVQSMPTHQEFIDQHCKAPKLM